MCLPWPDQWLALPLLMGCVFTGALAYSNANPGFVPGTGIAKIDRRLPESSQVLRETNITREPVHVSRLSLTLHISPPAIPRWTAGQLTASLCDLTQVIILCF